MTERECRLFIYGTLRRGEPKHGLLEGAELLGETTTVPAFYLVDLGPHAALVRGGTTAVCGELYRVTLEMRRRIDVDRQVPITFSRELIELAGGTSADAYLISGDRVRGRRRLAHGDWKKRFAPSAHPRPGGAWVAWSRGRWTK